MSPIFVKCAGEDAPQPVFRARSIEAMELFLSQNLEATDLISSLDGMPLLHYCVTSLTFHESKDQVRSLVTKRVLESLAEQVNTKWAADPEAMALPPGKS